MRRRKEDNRLRIHPLVRSVIKNEIKPTDKDCDQFLAALWKNFEHQYPPDVSGCRQAAELYHRAILDFIDERNLQSPCGRYTYYEGVCNAIAGETVVGLVYIKRAIESRESTPADYELAKMYLNAGIVNVKAICSDDALNFLRTALQIFGDTAPQSPEVAETFTAISLFYLKLENFSEALRHGEMALDFFQRYPPPPARKVDLSIVHSVLGNALLGKEKPLEAVEHLKIAADILKSLLPVAGHPDLAVSYIKLAAAYGKTKIFDKAIELANEAIVMQEKFLPEGHKNTASAYFTLAEIYALAGQSDLCSDSHNKALMYAQKAKTISKASLQQSLLKSLNSEKNLIEQMIKANHTFALAFRYQSVANTYLRLQDFANAEKYIELAMNSLNDENGDPSNKISTYRTASQICFAQENFEGALTYARRVLNLIETFKPEDFHMLGVEYMNIGTIYRNMRKYDEAVDFYRKSAAEELKCPNPDYSMIRLLETAVEGTLWDNHQK